MKTNSFCSDQENLNEKKQKNPLYNPLLKLTQKKMIGWSTKNMYKIMMRKTWQYSVLFVKTGDMFNVSMH